MKTKPIHITLITTIILGAIGISQSKVVYPQQRFRCKSVRVKLTGPCPDSIEASVYDAVAKDTLKYKFKSSSNANVAGQYITLKANDKGDIIAGQIIDASEKTIGLILMQDHDAKPSVKYPGEF